MAAFDRWDSDGDWTDAPWFLDRDGWEDVWEALNLPLGDRRRAVAPLRAVFPPEVCREIRDDASLARYGPVICLFDGIRSPALIAHLLELALDAELARPWEDAELLDRLRWRASHDEAAFEVRIQAALLRAGFTVQRVPRNPAKETPDFVAKKGGVTFEIEAKLANDAELDVVARELTDRLVYLDPTIAGLRITIRGSDVLTTRALRDLPRLRKELPSVVAAFARAIEQLRAAPAPGRIKVDDLGVIIAEREEGLGSFTDLSLPDLPEKKKGARVARLVRKGVSQLSGGTATGVVVVGVNRRGSPFQVEERVLEGARADSRYSRCKMVVLCDALPQPSRTWVSSLVPVFHAFSPRAYRKLRPREIELAHSVAAHRNVPAGAMRRSTRSGGEVDTTRVPRSIWKAAQTSFGQRQGTKVTMTINGRGERSGRVTSPEDAQE